MILFSLYVKNNLVRVHFSAQRLFMACLIVTSNCSGPIVCLSRKMRSLLIPSEIRE